ncbi:MAG: hypothetical protein K0M64_02900 [Rhizobium sp.]|nr:hypothetical protein [Rhizobium sp.]
MRIPTLLFAVLLAPAFASEPDDSHAQDGGLPESPAINIPYESPAAALAAVRAKPGVVTEEHEEWFVLNDSAESSVWSITKPGHFAHPTVVLRRTYERDGQVFIGMDVKCGSSKRNCDRVVQQFIALNNQIRERLVAE